MLGIQDTDEGLLKLHLCCQKQGSVNTHTQKLVPPVLSMKDSSLIPYAATEETYRKREE